MQSPRSRTVKSLYQDLAKPQSGMQPPRRSAQYLHGTAKDFNVEDPRYTCARFVLRMLSCTSETFVRSMCALFQATADALTVHGANKILLPLKLMELCIRHDYPEVRPTGQQLQ